MRGWQCSECKNWQYPREYPFWISNGRLCNNCRGAYYIREQAKKERHE